MFKRLIKMKKSIIYILAVAFVATLASCSISVPLLLSNNPIGNKKGSSSATCIFTGGQGARVGPVRGAFLYNGIMFNKDFSIYEAAKNGGINKIATVDLRIDWYVFFTKKTLIVTGE